MHFENPLFRDFLIKIIELSRESTLALFLQNLDDLMRLFETLSPVVNSFLENCFTETGFCIRINKVDMPIGTPTKVFKRAGSKIDTDIAQDEIGQKSKDMMQVQVNTKMMNLHWTY